MLVSQGNSNLEEANQTHHRFERQQKYPISNAKEDSPTEGALARLWLGHAKGVGHTLSNESTQP